MSNKEFNMMYIFGMVIGFAIVKYVGIKMEEKSMKRKMQKNLDGLRANLVKEKA